MPELKWYVVRVQSNKEEQVKESIEKRVKLAGMSERVAQVIVPSEQVTEIRGGKRRVFEKKSYPGYVMVEMEMADDTWYLVRETPGVGDFVGAGAKPVPMSQQEVDRMLGQAASVKGESPRLLIEFEEGDTVRITTGAFENFEGVVEEVDSERGRVKVSVTIFGRNTMVELEYWQVEKF